MNVNVSHTYFYIHFFSSSSYSATVHEIGKCEDIIPSVVLSRTSPTHINFSFISRFFPPPSLSRAPPAPATTSLPWYRFKRNIFTDDRQSVAQPKSGEKKEEANATAKKKKERGDINMEYVGLWCHFHCRLSLLSHSFCFVDHLSENTSHMLSYSSPLLFWFLISSLVLFFFHFISFFLFFFGSIVTQIRQLCLFFFFCFILM